IELVERPRAMVHDDLVYAPLLGDSAIIAPDRRQQLVSIAANGVYSKRNGEGHVSLLKGAHVGNEVHTHDFRREPAIERHDLPFAAPLGVNFSGLEGAVIACLIEYDRIRAWLCFSRDDLPR